MTGWKKERCSEKPRELQIAAPGIYIERKNIEEVEHEAAGGMDACTDYECDSREISFEEYQMLKSIEEIDTQRAIDDYTMQLVEEGVL